MNSPIGGEITVSMGVWGRADSDRVAAAARRLSGILAATIGALLAIGLGAVLALTSGLAHPSAAAADAATRLPAPVRGAPRLAPLPARLTSAPAPVPASTPAPVHTPPTTAAPAAASKVVVQIAPAAVPAGWSCAAALAYLAAHAAPGFTFVCPGYALGHQAMTCVNVAGVCPGTKLITISVVCPASYMNEAHNSWIIAGLATGSIDPYGYCP
ncbi:MAG TPA: hypothetical protein VFP54_00955 [Acidimicrobiales bacterium]|nr:hypothetical protein [Acidimicrobiales bacterium]